MEPLTPTCRGDLLLTTPVSLCGELPRRMRGAENGNRTRDLILTMDALYHLSYLGILGGRTY